MTDRSALPLRDSFPEPGYGVGDSAVLERQTEHHERRPLTAERRRELQAHVEENGEGIAAFHERYALDNGYETVVTHRTWDPATFTGTATSTATTRRPRSPLT